MLNTPETKITNIKKKKKWCLPTILENPGEILSTCSNTATSRQQNEHDNCVKERNFGAKQKGLRKKFKSLYRSNKKDGDFSHTDAGEKLSSLEVEALKGTSYSKRATRMSVCCGTAPMNNKMTCLKIQKTNHSINSKVVNNCTSSLQSNLTVEAANHENGPLDKTTCKRIYMKRAPVKCKSRASLQKRLITRFEKRTGTINHQKETITDERVETSRNETRLKRGWKETRNNETDGQVFMECRKVAKRQQKPSMSTTQEITTALTVETDINKIQERSTNENQGLLKLESSNNNGSVDGGKSTLPTNKKKNSTADCCAETMNSLQVVDKCLENDSLNDATYSKNVNGLNKQELVEVKASCADSILLVTEKKTEEHSRFKKGSRKFLGGKESTEDVKSDKSDLEG